MSFVCLQLEMQIRTNTLVLQVREEHWVDIVQHTDSLVGLADGMEQANTSFLTHYTTLNCPVDSRVQDPRVRHHGLNSPLQSMWVTVHF